MHYIAEVVPQARHLSAGPVGDAPCELISRRATVAPSCEAGVAH